MSQPDVAVMLPRFSYVLRASLGVILVLGAGCQAPATPPMSPTSTLMPSATPILPTTSLAENTLIPRPRSVVATPGAFVLTAEMTIQVEPNSPELNTVAHYLAEHLNPATGYGINVVAGGNPPGIGQIVLTTTGGDLELGAEGYELTISTDGVRLVANQPAGLFYGVQTLRQLLPAAIEQTTTQPGPWVLPTGTLRDWPRFEWRGAMLDVARHFFSVAEVKRYIDLLAMYKINRLHLHLTDDQGWRIAINAWPNLTVYGGSLEVGGGVGGYYTQADYSEIVAYAQQQFIMIVPEIDMPGHTNAALASYPELNCDGEPPELYTGTKVGFSSLCVDKEITYQFIDAVIKELAALTPGPYIHIGGDEAAATTELDYLTFITKVQAIVQAHGKQVMGWEEIAQSILPPKSIVQHWNGDLAVTGALQGAKVVMSPASLAYLDMKYDKATTLGQDWAGLITVEGAYAWEPVTHIVGLHESDVLGVEAPLWSETLQDIKDVEYMAFPRLPGLAEIGWSAGGRTWNEYKQRLTAHGPRWEVMDINFYRTPEVDWP